MNDLTQSVGASISGAAIIDAIKRSGVEFVVSVPDRVTSETVLRGVAGDPALELVRVCKEDEGVSICAALSFCDRRALLLMQNTGLLDSINALRGIAVEYQLPVVMMVGYREVHEFSELDALEAALPAMLIATGPVFVDLKVERGETYPQDFAYMHGRAARDKFKAALSAPIASV